MGLDTSTVVVAGSGPVGAVAALALAQAGMHVTVLEQGDGTEDPTESRASTFHPPTLEILDRLGVAEALHEVGLVADSYQYRDRTDGVVAHFDLAAIGGDTRFPYRLQSEQRNLVRIVRERLDALPNARVLDRTTVEGVDALDDPDGVRVTATGPDGPVTVSARWLIGADGAHSTVRESLGILFPGMTYPEQFLVISTPQDFAALLPDLASVNYVSDPVEWLVLLRTPVHWRVLCPIPAGAEAADQARAPAEVQRRLQAIAPLPGGYPVAHTRIYRVHQRVAETFRSGRVLLAGDAAHINNPLGGLGMNSGIHDAVAATEAVVAAEAGDTSLVDAYDATRRAVAHDYVRVVTHENYERLSAQDEGERAARAERMRHVAADPALARDYLLRTSMLPTDPVGATGGPR